MGALEALLAAAAILVGLTGTWSPCGFSAIETIGPGGHTGGRRITLAACATFAPGAVVGGVITFGALGWLGELLHGAGGRTAYLVAAGVAIAAAALEARGTRIVPQIRRQLPEHWRRVLPMPLAAALYGVLLGLGFTTFVLSFGVWALAGISLAVGDPGIGALIGVAFGLGRAVPIVFLAPISDRRSGVRVIETMATRPALYRGFRAGDAVVLAAAAAALVGTSLAGAANTELRRAADPSASGRSLVFQREPGTGFLRRGGEITELPGGHPAIGGPYIAVRVPGGIRLLDRSSLDPVADIAAGDAEALAVSGRWLAWRTRREGRDAIHARRIANPASPGEPKLIDSAAAPAQLSIPNLDGGRLVFARAQRRENRVLYRGLGKGGGGLVVRSQSQALTTPAVLGDRVLFVRIDRHRQHLVLSNLHGGHQRNLYSRDRGEGILWSTALTAKRAYATLLRGSRMRIISVGR